jgi:site-specific DNA-methyltransferase (adenine-specific)
MEPVEVEHFVARDAQRTTPKPKPERLPFKLYWSSPETGVWLYQADCLTFMDRVAERYPDGHFDMIFADPPYFLSNGGISCHAGRMVSVNKGDWDKSRGPEANHEFNLEWLSRCQRVLKPNGTIWVSGTAHVIHSVGYAMQQLGYKLLNDITWIKPNPPPNLSCRYFTHATETIIWAAKNAKSKHHFNYDLMRKLAGGRQMKSLWADAQRDADAPLDIFEVLPPRREEKLHGKHPTQKPVLLLERIILASTAKDALVLDPFMGSGTTGVAACRLGRRFVGLEMEDTYVAQAGRRVGDILELRRQMEALTRCSPAEPA